MSATITWQVTDKTISDNTVTEVQWSCIGEYNGDSHQMVGSTKISYEPIAGVPDEWQQYSTFIPADQATDEQLLTWIGENGVDKPAAEQFINDQLGAA